jgi:hypothetical protein
VRIFRFTASTKIAVQPSLVMERQLISKGIRRWFFVPNALLRHVQDAESFAPPTLTMKECLNVLTVSLWLTSKRWLKKRIGAAVLDVGIWSKRLTVVIT